MNRPKSPCVQDCPNRTAICKISCPKNLAYEKELSVWREERERQIRGEQDYAAHLVMLSDRRRKHDRYKRKGVGKIGLRILDWCSRMRTYALMTPEQMANKKYWRKWKDAKNCVEQPSGNAAPDGDRLRDHDGAGHRAVD